MVQELCRFTISSEQGSHRHSILVVQLNDRLTERIEVQALSSSPNQRRYRFLRIVCSSLDLSDHLPGSGILNYVYRSDRDWSLRVFYIGWWCLTHLKIDLVGTVSTPITAPMVSPKIGLLPNLTPRCHHCKVVADWRYIDVSLESTFFV